MIQFLQEVIEDLLLHIAHSELLLSILADFGNPGTAGTHIVLTDTSAGSLVNLRQMVVVQYELVRPRPAVVAVMIVDQSGPP